jgi:hypothetical protein
LRALELLWGEQLSRTVLPAPHEQSLRCGSIPASAVSHVRFGGRASAKSLQPLRGILRCVWHVSIGKRPRRAGTRGKQKPQVPDQSWTNNPSPSRSPFGAYGLPVLFIEEPTLFLMDNPPRRHPLCVRIHQARLHGQQYRARGAFRSFPNCPKGNPLSLEEANRVRVRVDRMEGAHPERRRKTEADPIGTRNQASAGHGLRFVKDRLAACSDKIELFVQLTAQEGRRRGPIHSTPLVSRSHARGHRSNARTSSAHARKSA